MGVKMLLQVIHLQLLEVTEVTDAEVVPARDLPVEGDELSEGGGRDEGGGYDVMVVVATSEDLVIALSEVGREGQAYQGQVGFVAQGELLLPKCKGVFADGRRHDLE